jgi:hypothetical protein
MTLKSVTFSDYLWKENSLSTLPIIDSSIMKWTKNFISLAVLGLSLMCIDWADGFLSLENQFSLCYGQKNETK